jgi:hypothetical protein
VSDCLEAQYTEEPASLWLRVCACAGTVDRHYIDPVIRSGPNDESPPETCWHARLAWARLGWSHGRSGVKTGSLNVRDKCTEVERQENWSPVFSALRRAALWNALGAGKAFDPSTGVRESL